MPEKENPSAAAQRAALYIRVSTEEQAMHGYSLAAQRESLTRYANAHNLTIVDYYVDEGKSARKKFQNRKEFMRMLDDVQAEKIDLILFIKLDRWFRSVKDYYKIQEILEAHHVNWKTTEENYDTTTTNGRLYINIRLSVAQDESDRDSDRIKFVFASKVARGETLVGAQSLPIGLTVAGKRVAPDPKTAQLARDIFAYYDLHQNNSATRRYLLQTYGIRIAHQNLSKLLSNRLYIGEYRGNPQYCEPVIDAALFDRVQNALKKNARKTPASRTYLFSGLLVCAECGHKMAGRYTARADREYYHYRCSSAVNAGTCRHRKTINEKELEQWLLENLERRIQAYQAVYRVKPLKREKPAGNRANLKRKLSRLKELYVDGHIRMEEYQADYERYTAQLAAIPEPEVQTDALSAQQKLMSSDFQALYVSLDRERRRALWRSIVKEIRVNAQNVVSVFFG